MEILGLTRAAFRHERQFAKTMICGAFFSTIEPGILYTHEFWKNLLSSFLHKMHFAE